MDYTNSPDYLKAADLHNVGSGSTSFFDAPIDKTLDTLGGLGNAVLNSPKFATVSIASGINSIYNSAVVAGNFFGVTNAEENNVEKTLSSFDSDLGQYYADNKAGADTVGFIATSLVPGIAGVKLANAGQRMLSLASKSGKVGTTLAETTGLAATATKSGLSLTEVAGNALAGGGQTFSFMNAGVLRAIGGGVAQATLEAAAFETMVQATMFRSPLLEGQDFKDIASNILTGTLLGGAIGGAINAAGVYGGIKKILTAADLEQKKFTLMGSRAGLEKLPSERILVGAMDLAATPAAVNAGEEALRTSRLTTIELERRTAIHELSKGDPELGNFLADATTGMTASQITQAYQGAKVILRPGTLVSATEGNTAGFVKLHGEGVGDTTFDVIRKGALSIADVTPGGKTEILRAVGSYSKGWKGSGDMWSPVTASSLTEIEARYIWAENIAKYKEGMVIHKDDIPLLEGALRNKLNDITMTDGVHEYAMKAVDIAHDVNITKMELAKELGVQKRAGWGVAVGTDKSAAVSTITNDEIARAVNVSIKRLESDEGASMFARQDAQAAHDLMRKEKGLSGESNLSFIPRHAAVIYDTTKISANGDTIAAMTMIKQQQKIQREATDRAVAAIAGDMFERMVHPGENAMLNTNRYGAGAGLVTSSNSGYNTLGSWSEMIGKVTSDLKGKLRADTGAIMDSALLKLRSNQVAAIEYDKIRGIVASTTEQYIMNRAGDGLIAKRLQKYMDDVNAGKLGATEPVLQNGAPDKIKFITPDAREAVMAHIEANGSRVNKDISLKNSLGLEDTKDGNIFYATKPDPKTMPFFAFVKDETVTGAGMGHTSMIHAASAEDLNKLIQLAREKTSFTVMPNPDMVIAGKRTVYTKIEAENFYKAQQSYEFDRTLHDNYIDSSLKSAGVNNQFFKKTDPIAIVDELAQWHARADGRLARDTISTKFAHEFDQLETLGQSYTNVAGSRYASNQKTIENTALNPYNDYRKTALDISRLGEHPILSSINKTLENGVSSVYQRITDVWKEARTVKDLDKVNDALQAAGVNHAYKSAAELILVNHTAPRPVVSLFIRRANTILANTFLRLDPMNALNNGIGAQVLLGTETSSQVRALGRQLEEMSIAVPGTSGDRMLSAPKLIANSNVRFFSRDAGTLDWYKKNGFMSNISDQFKSILDDLSLSGSETAVQMDTLAARALAKAKSFGDAGEKWTGNKFAEEYNRFVAADVAKQMSDAAIKGGVMQADGQLAYINTFVNRTQGNMLASQRPLIFQGPIGQAVGLFQTFQFNVIQQLFRGVAESGAKDAAMMMGLQGTLYGMNGLPGFQFINQHIVGTASGNPNHRDAYSTLYGAAGKEAGDCLMYGIPSCMLQANLYSRGDINPRNLTVIPIAPQDIVAVSAFGKFFGNMKETVTKIADGGNVWQSMLQGIEHNGLSRPLAGLAQTMQAADGGKAFSTTNSGNVSFVNDMFSWATLTRLAGAKPLDEALANDEIARSMVYKATTKERMKAATEAFKTTVIGDVSGSATPAATLNYMESFVRNGGRQEDFNKNMLNAMMTANTPRANQISETLRGPYGERMKSLMHGKVDDFRTE